MHLQRKCACGGTPGMDGECAQCRKHRLQRRAEGHADPTSAPPIVTEVLRTPGGPLDAETRALMEPALGHDFSRVRVHTGAQAAESAGAVNALAYTVGQDVVFGAGQHQPRTDAGQRLLAHELVHAVQQELSGPASQGPGWSGRDLRLGQPGDAYEREADALSAAVVGARQTNVAGGPAAFGLVQRAAMPLLQRRLVVNPADSIPLPAGQVGAATPLTVAVQGLLRDTCPDGRFQVDTTTGAVAPEHAEFCQQPPPPAPWLAAHVSSTPVGCQCLCDVVNEARTTTIEFRAGAPGTRPPAIPGTGQVPGSGGVRADPTVALDPRFQGQYRINGRWVDIPFHLIFAHEVCGHALPKMRGTHVLRGPTPAGGTPPSERHAVDVERAIAAEHNPPLPRRPEDYSGAARERP
jgi:hypothetical protein